MSRGKYHYHREEDARAMAHLAALIGGSPEAALEDAIKLQMLANERCRQLRSDRLALEAIEADQDGVDKLPCGEGFENLRELARAFYEDTDFDCSQLAPGPFRLLVAQAKDRDDPDLQHEALTLLLMVAGLLPVDRKRAAQRP